MVDSLEMLGGMEPQPGRKKRLTFLEIINHLEMRKVPVQRIEAKFFPQFVSCKRCQPAFGCSVCRTGLLSTSRFHRLPGSHRERPHAGAQPRARAAPSTRNALCFCCLWNSWSSRQSPALRSPRPRSLSGLNFCANPTPTLLWAALASPHLPCYIVIDCMSASLWAARTEAGSYSLLCPQCVRQSLSSQIPSSLSFAGLCLCYSRADPAGCSPQPPGLLASGWGQPKGGPPYGRPEGWGRENPRCLFCILGLSSVSGYRVSGISRSQQQVHSGPIFQHVTQPGNSASSFAPQQLLAVTDLWLPCCPLFESSAFASPCDQIHFDCHVCYTLRVVLRAACTLRDTPLPVTVLGTEWALGKCLWNQSGGHRVLCTEAWCPHQRS